MRHDPKPKVVVICGPTGIGKTAVAITLANEFDAEIINADSMQIYRRMDIGTAKPTPAEQKTARHHLINIREPDESFDAAVFVQTARTAAAEILARGRLPLLVGGTGLYIKAFLHGLFQTAAVDPAVRARLQADADIQGSETLYRRLAEVDPAAAARLHPNDLFRIVRALETLETSGESISKRHAGHQFKDEPYEALKIGLHIEREELYRRIDRRVEAMLSAGLEQEVRQLLAAGFSSGLKSMQSIGYRHMADYIQDRISMAECIRTLKRDTRRYAKRQLTWFGADEDILWYAPQDLETMRVRIKQFLSERKSLPSST